MTAIFKDPKKNEKAKNIRRVLASDGVDSETIEKFIEWFFDNEKAWAAFKRFASFCFLNKKKVGAKAVAERVRWETEIENNGEFKVNNNYVAYMARLYNANIKKEYFETREVRGLAA